jgi:gas vesicle protein
MYCDNKSLIKRITSRRKVRMTVNQHRDAEVDLELQVLHELRMLEKDQSHVILQYVKGHKQTTKDQFVSNAEHLYNYADTLRKEARSLPN